tara:strand:- start:160 stop:591 length:432 start_codon:yes stop_codon:yes gene_type:complete
MVSNKGFTKGECEELEQAVNDALDQVQKKFEVVFNVTKNKRIKSGAFQLKLEANKALEPYKTDYLAKDYIESCEKFDLQRLWLGEKFLLEGKAYKIVGLIKANNENPLVVLNEDQVRNKMPAKYAVEYFAANPVKPKFSIVES